MQEQGDHFIEYEGPADLGVSYLGGYFRVIRPGHHDREVAFRLSEYTLEEFCERFGYVQSPDLAERVLVAWARHEIERELRVQGRVNPIIVGASATLDLDPDLLTVLQDAAATEPEPEPSAADELVEAHAEPVAAGH